MVVCLWAVFTRVRRRELLRSWASALEDSRKFDGRKQLQATAKLAHLGDVLMSTSVIQSANRKAGCLLKLPPPRIGASAFLLRAIEQRENRHRGSIKERRAAATKDNQRHPNSRRRRGKGGPDQSRTRSRPGCWLRALPRCHGLPHRAGRVARRRAHGLRCWRPTPPRLRFLLLHQASGEAARGMIAPAGDIRRSAKKVNSRKFSSEAQSAVA